jgi:acyl-ACP thioesterase
MSVYRQELLLRSKHVDMYRRLRTSELFRLLQEASIRHTEELGMGRDKTLDRGILWVLGLQRAEIVRMPEYDEEIVLKSWPGKTMHVLFPRYYSLETRAGEPLLRASALWTLVDEKTRKMVFPEKAGIVIDGVTTGEEIALPSPPPSMECGESLVFTVPYSYVDINGHMNNCRFFDLAEDVTGAAAAGRTLREIRSEYSSEALLGQELTVRWGNRGGRYFVSGETGQRVFRMELVYND